MTERAVRAEHARFRMPGMPRLKITRLLGGPGWTPGVPVPKNPCCRRSQLRHAGITLVDVARGRLSPGRAVRLEYRRACYLNYLLAQRRC